MVGFGISIGKICWLLEGIVSSEDGGVVALLPLGVTVVSAAPLSGASVTLTTRMVGSGGEMEVVAIGCVRGTT